MAQSDVNVIAMTSSILMHAS